MNSLLYLLPESRVFHNSCLLIKAILKAEEPGTAFTQEVYPVASHYQIPYTSSFFAMKLIPKLAQKPTYNFAELAWNKLNPYIGRD